MEVTGGQDVTSSSVWGGGSAATGPNRFLTAAIWQIDNTQLGQNDLTDWVFWFNEAAVMNLSSGVFTVTVANGPLIKGAGAKDGDYYGLHTAQGHGATGTLDNQTGQWEMEYNGGGLIDHFTVHLEGVRGSVPAMMMLGLSACALYSLGEVPIEGGSPEARELVRGELAAFEAMSGPDRIRLRVIRFASLDERLALGAYTPSRHTLELDEDLPLPDIADVLRHELCHALDASEDLLTEPDSLWDEMSGELRGEEMIEGYRAAVAQRVLRGEAMASLCGAGPQAAAVLAQPCEGDPSWMAPASAWLLERVWKAFSPPGVLQPPPRGSWLPGVTVDGMVVDGTLEPYVVNVSVVEVLSPEDWEEVRVFFDMRSGPLDWPAGAVDNDPGSGASSVEGLVPGISSYGDAITLPQGGQAAALYFSPVALPGSAVRLLWSDGEGWQAVEGSCPRDPILLVSAERAWAWWSEGEAVLWRQLGP